MGEFGNDGDGVPLAGAYHVVPPVSMVFRVCVYVESEAQRGGGGCSLLACWLRAECPSNAQTRSYSASYLSSHFTTPVVAPQQRGVTSERKGHCGLNHCHPKNMQRSGKSCHVNNDVLTDDMTMGNGAA